MKKLFLIIVCFIPFNVYSLGINAKYYKCVDGDTFKVIINKSKYSVRLLSIDTLELKSGNKYASVASKYTCKRIRYGKIVLEFDNKSSLVDKYGRLLAFVFIDGTLLQKELVDKGYARVYYLFDEYKYNNLLIESEKKAKLKKVGIWK